MDFINAVNVVISIVIALTLFLGIGWKAWAKLVTIVNGFGDRLTRAEKDVAKNEADITAIRNELRSERDLIMNTMNSNEKAAAERHAQLRVDFARMEERLDIEALVRTITREVRDIAK